MDSSSDNEDDRKPAAVEKESQEDEESQQQQQQQDEETASDEGPVGIEKVPKDAVAMGVAVAPNTRRSFTSRVFGRRTSRIRDPDVYEKLIESGMVGAWGVAMGPGAHPYAHSDDGSFTTDEDRSSEFFLVKEIEQQRKRRLSANRLPRRRSSIKDLDGLSKDATDDLMDIDEAGEDNHVFSTEMIQAEVAPNFDSVVQDAVERAIKESLKEFEHSQRQLFAEHQRQSLENANQPITAELAVAQVVSANANSTADADEEDDQSDKGQREYEQFCGLPKGWFCTLLVIGSVCIAIAVGILAAFGAFSPTVQVLPIPELTAAPTLSPTETPSASPTEGGISKFISRLYPNHPQGAISKAQYDAARWIVEVDEKNLDTSTLRQEVLERHALVTLYFATNGEYWRSKSRWLSVADHCLWQFVECNEEYSIVNVDFASQNLTGTLPPDIGRFKNLQTMDFSNNRLNGIPSEIGLCTDLTRLLIEGNSLASLPSEIGQLSSTIVEINLNSNSLQGEMPSEVGGLTQLTRLSLTGNLLSGKLPTEIGFLKNLRYMFINDNLFEGIIPSEIGNLQMMTALNLAGNKFDTMPTELFSLTNLVKLFLQRNEIVGSIPTFIGRLSALDTLKLSNNVLSGSMPSELGNMRLLSYLEAEKNQLSGPMPTELGNLSLLATLRLGDNDLTGHIHSEFSGMVAMVDFSIHTNNLSGLVPASLDSWPNIRSVELSQNNFSGGLNNLFCDRILEVFNADCYLACRCCNLCDRL